MIRRKPIRVRELLEPVEGVRQVVVNRAQGYSLNLVIEDEPVISRLRDRLDLERDLPVFALRTEPAQP